MKKNKGDEPIQVIIHIHGNITGHKEITCVNYLNLKQENNVTFFFFLLQNQRTRGWNRSYPW
jgi:hypothetical protein